MKFIASDKRFIIFPMIFLFIYIFVAAVPLGSDIYFLPVWVREVIPDAAKTELEGVIEEKDTVIQAEASQFSGKIPKMFITNNRFGFFTDEGTVLRSAPITKRISASSAAWTEYAEDTVQTPIYRPDGSLITAIDGAGFIHIDEDRFYLFEAGGSAVKQYSAEGKMLWRYLHTAPITAFNTSKRGTVIGFSDGKLVCLNSEGKVVFDFYPGGSNYQIILGAALSQDGRSVVCVCGLEQQRVLFIRIDGNKYKIVHHRYLDGNLRRQVFTAFDDAGENAVFECAEGMGFIDCKRQVSGIIPQEGILVGSGDHPYKNIMAVISQQDKASTLSFIESPFQVIGQTSFPAKNVFLLQEHKTLFLVADTKLVRIDIKGTLK